jgi:hypothetical protein
MVAAVQGLDPSANRRRHPAVNVAKRLVDVSVLDPEGRSVRLGDLWREQTIVLAFIRHFG